MKHQSYDHCFTFFTNSQLVFVEWRIGTQWIWVCFNNVCFYKYIYPSIFSFCSVIGVMPIFFTLFVKPFSFRYCSTKSFSVYFFQKPFSFQIMSLNWSCYVYDLGTWDTLLMSWELTRVYWKVFLADIFHSSP